MLKNLDPDIKTGIQTGIALNFLLALIALGAALLWSFFSPLTFADCLVPVGGGWLILSAIVLWGCTVFFARKLGKG